PGRPIASAPSGWERRLRGLSRLLGGARGSARLLLSQSAKRQVMEDGMSTSYWKLMVGLVAASSASVGCVGTEAEFADREFNLIADDEPAQPGAALASALATPE